MLENRYSTVKAPTVKQKKNELLTVEVGPRFQHIILKLEPFVGGSRFYNLKQSFARDEKEICEMRLCTFLVQFYFLLTSWLVV